MINADSESTWLRRLSDDGDDDELVELPASDEPATEVDVVEVEPPPVTVSLSSGRLLNIKAGFRLSSWHDAEVDSTDSSEPSRGI